MMKVQSINTNTVEGKLLSMAISKITTESQLDKTPNEVLDQLKELSDQVYGKKKLGINFRTFTVKSKHLIRDEYNGRRVKLLGGKMKSGEDYHEDVRLVTNNENDFVYEMTDDEYNERETIRKIIKILSKDKLEGSCYYSWQSNIAMAFVDEWEKYSKEIVGRNKTYDCRVEIANNAAKRFLDQLIG